MFSLSNPNHRYIASVVATYWFVSISMVYLNKVLVSNENVSIPAPLFVTWFQCVVTAWICYGAGVVGERSRKRYTPLSDGGDGSGSRSFFNQFPKVDYNFNTAKRVFPLSVVFVAMITFNNLCLKWVEVSFYNVARSLTIVFNVIFTSTLLGNSTSVNTMMCLGVVIFGFLIGSEGELNFSLHGTIAGICSSVFVSLNSIYTKKILPAVDDDHWKLTFYNNVNATILFIPLMIIFETSTILSSSKQFTSLLFWCAMMVAGFFGFSIGIVTVLQIKATSPLTHNISGTAKAAVQSMLAFYIWGNKATFLGILGIFTVLGGSLMYTMVKLRENKAKSCSSPSDGRNAESNSEGESKGAGKV